MDDKVVPCQRAFFHGHTSMVQFLKNAFLKPLGPSLGINQIWTNKSDHAPKSGCADLFDICPKRAILGFFFMFDLLPFFPCNYCNKNKSNYKTRWTMTMDKYMLGNRPFGTSSSMVTLTFFSQCKPKWSGDKFNSQSYILEEQRMTPWSMM